MASAHRHVARGAAPLAALAMTALVATAGGGRSASAADTSARAAEDRIILTSNRTGARRGYSVRADGSGLTPLLGPRSRLMPEAVSGDGRTIAYANSRFDSWGIYVSRASGAGLRRVAAPPASSPTLSRDGRLVAFTTRKPGIWIVGADGSGLRRLTSRRDALPQWSPDGKSVLFFRLIGEGAGVFVVQPLRGTRRVLTSTRDNVAKWSPDGRWIAYKKNENELWVVRPSGAQRRRIARQAAAFDWAPDGRRLAFTTGGFGAGSGDVAVVGLDGRGRRLRARMYVVDVRWSPDGRRLAVVADGYATAIWMIGVDGRGLRRVTNEGSSRLVGWTRLAPVRAPARAIPRTERVVGPDALTTRAPIGDVAADGPRVAFDVGTTATDCRHVAVWTPARRAFRRLPDGPAPCGDISIRDDLGPVTLAGTRAAWIQTGGGNTQEESVVTATLARPDTVELRAGFSNDLSGTFVTGLAGEGSLVAFSVEQRCDRTDPDDRTCPRDRSDRVIGAAVYRLGGAGPCPFDRRVPRACTLVTTESGPLAVLAVDAGRIAVRTGTGIRLLSETGGVLRNLPLRADVAVLSGDRLAVRTATGVDVYDVASGRLVASVPVPRNATLEDLDGGVVVIASGSTVTLRRLADGRTATFDVTGRARAQLEPPGLFVAGDRRLTFVPMAAVVRRLGG